MRTIFIVYHQFFDRDGINVQIGGVETYLYNLASILNAQGYNVGIYQAANFEFTRNYQGINVVGIPTLGKNVFQTLMEWIEKKADCENDLLIFGADIAIVKSKFKNVIAIQHGIGWDIPSEDAKKRDVLRHFMKNVRTSIAHYNQYKYCSKVVCVDYNFLNWYRTFWKTGAEKMAVIPNFSVVPDVRPIKNNANLSIVFARRFQEFRGTRVFGYAIKDVLKHYPNLKICIAGNGPDEKWLKENLKDCPQVYFDMFRPQDSIEFHENFDIAVVPSTGSEGTSLSLLEAMSAGCAVISSDVGGLTSIIIDGYNGLIVRAEKDMLTKALCKLIDDKKLRESFAQRGYDTVKDAFSFEVWEDKWLQIVEDIICK